MMRRIDRHARTLLVLALAATGVTGAGQAAPPARVVAAPATTLFTDRLEEIDLRDVSLRDALTLISKAAGQNLVASDDAAKTKVTISLRNVTPAEAVQAICQTHGLFYNKKLTEDGIDIVTTVKEFQQGLTIFREEKTVVFTLLYPNAMDLAAAIRNLFGNRVRLSRGKDDIFDDTQDIQRRLDRFDIINSRSQGLTQSLTNSGPNGSSGNSGSSGFGNSQSNRGSSSGSTSGAGSLNLNQPQEINPPRQNDLSDLTAEQIARVAKLVRPEGAGVGVDAEKLAGVRVDAAPIYVTVLNRNNQIIVRTSDANVIEEITQLKSKIDIPTPQVLLEVKVLSVELSDGFNSVFDFQYGNQKNTAGFSTGPILPGASNGTVGGQGEASGPFGLNTTSLIYQYVNDNFRFRMQMLDARNKVTTLATPLLLVANNEVSSVFIGQQFPIVQAVSSQTTAVQGVVQTTPNTNFSFVPVGTTLLITPNINADRTVTLRLLQENSSVITGGASIPILGSNGTVVNQPLDVVSAQSLSGTVIAKDGLSLALGGLIQESVTDQREEIPVLGELPYVGILFRRQTTGRSRHELIIVIRPFVLSTPAEAEAAGKRLTDANSLHPKASNLNPAPGEAIGSMRTYLPNEVLRPNPPRNELEKIFHLHSALPRAF